MHGKIINNFFLDNTDFSIKLSCNEDKVFDAKTSNPSKYVMEQDIAKILCKLSENFFLFYFM